MTRKHMTRKHVTRKHVTRKRLNGRVHSGAALASAVLAGVGLSGVGLTGFAPAGFAPAAAAAGPAAKCDTAKGIYAQSIPWPQRLLDPQRVWPLSTGVGQTVAVIGTGIDAGNKQFAPGQVLLGTDLTPAPKTPKGKPAPRSVAAAHADDDCDGRGTFAAGIIAAQANSATTFVGLAPGAKLLPIRYTQATGNGAPLGDPNKLAAAITAASHAHAGVILVVVPAGTDSPLLRRAVTDAINAGSVVIASAAASDETGTNAHPHSYPASDPGVIGVGSINAGGAAVQSESGPAVTVAAPGADLVSTAPTADGQLGHSWNVSDPEFSGAFVAGTVALLRAYQPQLTPAQVATRLSLTADRGAGVGRDARLGWGVIDPYAALTSTLPADAANPGTATGPAGKVQRIAAAPAPTPRPAPDRLPGLVAILGLAAAVIAGVTAAAARRGWARRWRSGRATT